MAYKNPIPNVDDEYVAKTYSVAFTFEDNVTRSEAADGINRLIKENGGKLPEEWVRMAGPGTIRYASPQK